MAPGDVNPAFQKASHSSFLDQPEMSAPLLEKKADVRFWLRQQRAEELYIG